MAVLDSTGIERASWRGPLPLADPSVSNR